MKKSVKMKSKILLIGIFIITFVGITNAEEKVKKYNTMRKLLLFTFAIFFTSLVYAQDNAYIDAVKLDSIFKEYKGGSTSQLKEEFWKILGKYGYDDSNKDSLINNNPFFEDSSIFILENKVVKREPSSLPTYSIHAFSAILGGTDAGSLISTSRSSLSSSTWQTSIIQGTADFMAERFKDELINYGMNKLTDACKLKDIGIDKLFPTVTAYLKQIKDKPYYSSDFTVLRYNAEYDIQHLHENLPAYLSSHLKIDPKTIEIISFYISLATDLKNSTDPVDAINRIAEKDSLFEVPNLIKTVSNSLRASDYNSIWVNYNDIDYAKIEEDLKVKYFYGLLFEKLKKSKTYSMMYDNKGKLLYPEKVKKICKQLTSIQNLYNSFDKDKPLTIDNFKIYILLIKELYEPYIKKGNVKLANNLLELSEIIEAKEYKMVLPQLLQVYMLLDNDKLLENRESYRYISFLVSLTQAETSEDVKSLINSIALPVGSYSLKRSAKWNISINGYVGLTGGIEFLKTGEGSNYWNLGLSAPIGITFSTTSLWEKKSLSVFLSIIDLGSLVNKNLTDDGVNTENDLRFNQFLSPGIGLYFNLGKTPLTFGVRGYYSPSAREFNKTVDEQVETMNNVGVYRVNFSILVDIPLLNLLYIKN